MVVILKATYRIVSREDKPSSRQQNEGEEVQISKTIITDDNTENQTQSKLSFTSQGGRKQKN